MERRPNRRTAGVPFRYVRTYQEFLAENRPFDVSRELAMLRTLQVELRDIIDGRAPIRLKKMSDDAAEAVRARVSRADDRIQPDALFRIVSEEVNRILQTSFAVPATSSAEIREMSVLLERTARVADTLKKIQEGVKLDVTINHDMIVRILQMAVFPAVPESDRRRRILHVLQGMSMGPLEPHPPLPDVSGIPVDALAMPVPSLEGLLEKVPVAHEAGGNGELLPIEVPAWS